MKSWLNKNIIGFCSASFFGDWCHEMGTAILPMFITQLVSGTYAPFALGFIQGFADAGATITKLLSGYLADRVPFYKPFLIAGYGISGVCLALIGTVQSIIFIFVYKTIAWLAKGIREPMRDTWIAKIVPRNLYGRVFGLQRSLDTLGALVGPLTTFFLLKINFSLTSVFLFSAIPAIFSVLSIMFLTHEEKRETMVMHDVHFIEQVKVLPSDFISFAWIMFLFGVGNFNQTLLIYRVQEIFGQEHSFLIATTHGVLLYAFFNVIRAFSEFGMGTLSDYVNRKMLLAVFGFGAFGITTLGFMVHVTPIWFWLLCFGCAGLSAGTVKALEKAHASYILPEQTRGVGLGLLQSIDGVGDLLSSLIVGALWSFISPLAGLIYAAIISFIAMVLLIFQRD
ncbi:MAG TPA: MFS transporter [Candidatus Babeliales bacterium]|nr:MFS transporter [Candidatus Babeliales bacterium]